MAANISRSNEFELSVSFALFVLTAAAFYLVLIRKPVDVGTSQRDECQEIVSVATIGFVASPDWPARTQQTYNSAPPEPNVSRPVAFLASRFDFAINSVAAMVFSRQDFDWLVGMESVRLARIFGKTIGLCAMACCLRYEYEVSLFRFAVKAIVT